MEREIPYKFDVLIDSTDLTPTSDPELYTTKLRVFYKGLNRNGSYITEEYADRLALSAYSKPVLGAYNYDTQRFGGHEGPIAAKAYGYIIPGSLTWTEHFDKDGTLRTYATYDALLWAAYWEEAKKIIGKGESMEIDVKTISGDWRLVDNNGTEAFFYTDGVMAGVTVLGDTKEPCFEGAAFFSTKDVEYNQFMKAISNYLNGGNNTMENEENVIEQEQPEVDHAVIVEDEEHVIQPEEPVVEEEHQETEQEVTEPEAEAEDSNEAEVEEEAETNEYEQKYNELMTSYNELKAQYDELSAKYDEQSASLEQANCACGEKDKKHQAECEEYDLKIANLNDALKKYETAEKQRIIDKFTKSLPSDIMQEIANDAEKMTVNELNTRCAVEYTNFSMAKEEQEPEIHIPRVDKPSALSDILNRYKK